MFLMILDHLTILLADYFGQSWYGGLYYALGRGDAFTRFCYWWTISDLRTVMHNIVLVFFFGVSGISCTLSRSNRKRGAMLMIIAIIYTLCTLFAEQVLNIGGVLTIFGVLNFLAACMLMYALISWACKQEPYAISIVAVGIIGITLILYFCFTPPATTPKIFAIIFPPHDINGNPSLFYRQFDFSPGDLFTMIPYTAYYFLGVLVAPLLYGKRRSLLPKLEGKWSLPIRFIGKHALTIYVLHVVAMALLLSVISYLFITPGSFGL